MKQRTESLTVTLHWLAESGEQTSNIVCEDSPPAQLIPLLLSGCGLPLADASGRTHRYALRLGGAAGRPLRHSEPASAQGVRSGIHLWLSECGPEGARRCLLALPDGSELLLPRAGATLTRAWLLQALALLNPEGHARELALLERRDSRYRYVSNRPHCSARPNARGGWSVSTGRSDVATLLNGKRLLLGALEPLGDGDRLTLGDDGLELAVALLGEHA